MHPFQVDYLHLGLDEKKRLGWRILHRPQRVQTPEQGPFYVVHLYAGRRREDDFHACMTELLHSSQQPWARNILAISMDTAIHESMNVHGDQLWGFLLSAARPPCETWSNARFAVL